MITKRRVFFPTGEVRYIVEGVLNDVQIVVETDVMVTELGNLVMMTWHCPLEKAILAGLDDERRMSQWCDVLTQEACYSEEVKTYEWAYMHYVDWAKPTDVFNASVKVIAWVRGILRGEEW